MITYFVYRYFIFECIICDFLLDNDPLSKAIGIVGTLFFGILGLVFVIADIAAIPLYLLILFLALIIKLIDVIRGEWTMIHILRLIVGTFIIYLIASSILVFTYFADDDMDSLPMYIKIPGVFCWSVVTFVPIILLAYILGGVILG